MNELPILALLLVVVCVRANCVLWWRKVFENYCRDEQNGPDPQTHMYSLNFSADLFQTRKQTGQNNQSIKWNDLMLR